MRRAASARRRTTTVVPCVVTALAVGGAVATLLGCTAMNAMGAQPMPGGWMLSNAWIGQCGRAPAGFALAFLGHWLAMTAAMMLPSFVPALRRCQASFGAAHPGWSSLQVVLGYFAAWTTAGLAVFAAGLVLTGVALREPVLARCFPFGATATVLVAGVLQFGAWKSRHLAACRPTSPRDRSNGAAGPWWHGVHVGRHCACACAGWMATLLVTGAMDLRMMALVTLAISAERLAPDSWRIVEATGAALIGFGFALLVQATAAS